MIGEKIFKAIEFAIIHFTIASHSLTEKLTLLGIPS
jgi:hypothetical protein